MNNQTQAKVLIYQTGLPGIDQPERIGIFKGSLETIKNKLRELQKPYMENGDRSKIQP